MDISAKPIAAAMGKGRDNQCEVVGQGSFASPTGLRLSTVARACRSCVCEVLRQQATATLTVVTPVVCGCGVPRVCGYPK